VQRAVASEEIHFVLESCGIVDDHALNEQELFDLNLGAEAWELKADEYALHRADNAEDGGCGEEDIIENNAEEDPITEESAVPQQETISELTMSAIVATSDAVVVEENIVPATLPTDVSNDAGSDVSVSTAAATVGTVSSPYPEDNVVSPLPTSDEVSASVNEEANEVDVATTTAAAAEQDTATSENAASTVAAGTGTKEKKSMFSYLFGSSKKK